MATTRHVYKTSVTRHSAHVNYESDQARSVLLAVIAKHTDGMYQHDRRAKRVSIPLRGLTAVCSALAAGGHQVLDRQQLDLWGWSA